MSQFHQQEVWSSATGQQGSNDINPGVKNPIGEEQRQYRTREVRRGCGSILKFDSNGDVKVYSHADQP